MLQIHLTTWRNTFLEFLIVFFSVDSFYAFVQGGRMSVLHVPNFVWGWIEAYHSLNLLNSLIFHPTAHTVTVFFCHVDPMRRLKDMQRCLNTDGHLFSVKTWNSLLFQLFEWRGKEQKFHRNLLHLYTICSCNFGAKRGDIFQLRCETARGYHVISWE